MYVCKHKAEHQSLKGLARQTNIPYSNIRYLLTEYFELKGSSLLASVARTYHISFYVYPQENWDKNHFNESKIIDAEQSSFCSDLGGYYTDCDFY